jgi:hypothetical protein
MSPIKHKNLSVPLIGLLRKWFASHPTQSMIEFVMALPVLLLLVFCIIEFGRLLHVQLMLENGARLAVRYTITGSYDSNFCPQAAIALDYTDDRPAVDGVGNTINMNYVQLDLLDGTADCIVLPKVGSLEIDNSQEISSALQNWAHLTSIRASVPSGADLTRSVDGAGAPGDRVRVVLTYRHALITPFLRSWWPPLLLTAEREGIVEKSRTLPPTGQDDSINVAATWTYAPPSSIETPALTSTPAPGCDTLTNLGGSEALMFRENNSDIESWLSNSGSYNIRLTGAKLDGELVWHNEVNPAPAANKFRYYWSSSAIYDPPDTSALPISHNWPNTNAAVISPGSSYLFRWNFNNNFFLKPYVRSYPQIRSGTPTPAYEPGPEEDQGFFWPSDLNGEIYYAVGNPSGPTVTCTMQVTGGKGPQINLTYRNGISQNINTSFFVSAAVTWNSVASNKDYIYLYVYDSSGVLVHWTKVSGSAGPLCLFGATGRGACRTRQPYVDNWSYDDTDNGIQIKNGKYTIAALARGRTLNINSSRRIKSGMIFDMFTISAVVPITTSTTKANTPIPSSIPAVTGTALP